MAEAAFSLHEMRRLNRELTEVVKSVSGEHSYLELAPKVRDEVLKQAFAGRTFEFRIRGKATGRAVKPRGGEVELVMVRRRTADLARDVWVSGYIAWRKNKNGAFDLLKLGWSFFVGGKDAGSNRMLLRAEWQGDPRHPQPHWHFDDEILMNAEGEAAELSRLHLPMSGWTHTVQYSGVIGEETVPTCWTPQALTVDFFKKWSDRTLRIASDQLDYFLKTAGV